MMQIFEKDERALLSGLMAFLLFVSRRANTVTESYEQAEAWVETIQNEIEKAKEKS